MNLQTWKPGTIPRPKREAIASPADYSGVECDGKCWSCRKKFKMYIGFENLHISVFKCPNCNEENEIE